MCRKLGSSQTVRMMAAISRVGRETERILSATDSARSGGGLSELKFGEFPECPSDAGIISYWNTNKKEFHVEVTNKDWAPCANITYSITESGSLRQYAEILLNRAVKVWLYSGDWDDVVPFGDTAKNVQSLGIKQEGDWKPWFVENEHAGFYQ
jgi:hypothetical protein